MRVFLCRFCAVLLLLAMIFPLITAVDAKESGENYGEAYHDLRTEEQRIAYRLVEEGIAGLAPVINFEGVVEIFYRDLLDVVRAVCVDHPQYFWFLEQGSYNYENTLGGNMVNYFEPEYILDGEVVHASSQELADAILAFNTKVMEILEGIPVNCTTEMEIALYLHDYLADLVTYSLEGDHPSAYAALIHGEAACYGYSKAYQCLLNAAGIRSRTITGTSRNYYGNIDGHAWNQIWLDGKCYYIDVTWDDQETFTLHGCFAVSLETFSEDHKADPEFILPACGHEASRDSSFFANTGIPVLNNQTTATEAAGYFHLDCIEGRNAFFTCEIRFEDGDFYDWLDSNERKLITALNLSNNAKLYCVSFYNTFYLRIVDQDFREKDYTIRSVALDTDEITLPGPGSQYQLRAEVITDFTWSADPVYESSDESVATVNQQGIVMAVGQGTAVITARSADGGIRATCRVKVEKDAVHIHELRYFDAVAPSCTQEGHLGYYTCTTCGLRFKDQQASAVLTETSDYFVPATGHQDLKWEKRPDYHIQLCSCGVFIQESKADHADIDSNGKCDVCSTPFGIAKPTDPTSQTEKNTPGWILPVVIGGVVVAVVVVVAIVLKKRYYW